jgi:hypothetical protein
VFEAYSTKDCEGGRKVLQKLRGYSDNIDEIYLTD